MIILLKNTTRISFFLLISLKCCVDPFFLKGQVPKIADTLIQRHLNEDLLQHHMEDLAEELEEDTDLSPLIVNLEDLLNKPLNLNKATADELRKLIFLNEIQIMNLLEHIRQYGKLLSISELQTIEGFDTKTILAIQPYISVDEKPFQRHLSIDEVIKQSQHQFFLRWQRQLEQPRGFEAPPSTEDDPYPQPKYPGSPYRLYSRYRLTCYNFLSLGFTAEKDPGEQFFKGSQPYGFDYYSGHIFLRDLGRLKAMVVGDYQLQFGQGLTLWSGLTFGKGSDAMGIHKYGQGLRPHTGSEENAFFRGAGINIALGTFEFTGFFSSKPRDARIWESDSLDPEILVISSLQQSGLHRTPSELSARKTVREGFFGGHLAWKRKTLSLGLTVCHMVLKGQYEPKLSFYNQFDFNRNHNTNLGCDYSFVKRNFHFFGELATSKNSGFALLNGLVLSLDPRLSLALLHRHFSKNYQGFYATAFGENSHVANEQGLYLGLHVRLSRHLNLKFYADHFSFPWMRYRTNSPTHGYDYLAQLNCRFRHNTELYLRYRIRNKPLNTQETIEISFPEDAVRHNLRLNFSHDVSPSLTLRNRLEFVRFRHGIQHEQGFCIYQDMLWHNSKKPWSITLRYALFDTEGYNSRIYVFENDVLYAFSFPFYYHKGSRAYILIKYRLNRYFDLNGRLAQTFYAQPVPKTTGPDGVDENTRTEIKLQLRARF